MKPYIDSGFLLAVLTERAGAQEGWNIIGACDAPLLISSLQLYFIRHGLNKNRLNKNSPGGIQEECGRALKMLDWFIREEILLPLDADYAEVIQVADGWAVALSSSVPAQLLICPACAVSCGSTHFLSFDSRCRALAEEAGLKVLPARLK